MTTKLTEEEREIWKDAYRVHEHVHDITGTENDWVAFLTEIAPMINDRKGSAHRLAYKLMLALYDYMSEEIKIRQEEARWQPEQVNMLEEIPWN